MTKNQLEEKEDRQQNVLYGTHTGDQIGGQKWKGAFESSGYGEDQPL